jgi:hypothetical protein
MKHTAKPARKPLLKRGTCPDWTVLVTVAHTDDAAISK